MLIKEQVYFEDIKPIYSNKIQSKTISLILILKKKSCFFRSEGSDQL